MNNVPELSQQAKQLQSVARDLYKFGIAAQETGNILQVGTQSGCIGCSVYTQMRVATSP